MSKFGLIGYRLSHSYSPMIHEYLFKKNNIDASYSLIEVELDELKECIERLKDNTYSGYNVTIPYKEKIMAYCDILTDAAKEIGAVNTVYMRDGKVIGDNTDYLGFIAQLEMHNIDVLNKNVYVLGNGGASKAICYSLKMLNANPIIVSRTDKGISYEEFSKIDSYDIIINTTPLGMYPNVNDCVLKEEIIKKADICIDLIFNPKVTKFLSHAKIGYNGLFMLIFQAIHAEKLWLKKEISFELNELLEMF